MEDIVTEGGIEKFRAAVTVYVSVMVKALSVLAGIYSHMAVYTRAGHALHLIVGDITKLKSAEDTVDTCTCIIKEINKSHILKANFTELQKELVQIFYSSSY